VRGVGGAVVTFPSDRDTAKLWLSSEEVDQSKEDTLYRLPITTCTTCGQHYYTHHVSEFKFYEKDRAPQKGRLVGTRQIWQPLGAERGGHKVTLVDRLINIDDDESTATSHPDSTALTYFCRHCGTLHSSPVQGDNESSGSSKQQNKNRCDNCGALGDPIERMWGYIKQFLAWHVFDNLEQLHQKVDEVLLSLTSEVISSVTGFQFILDALSVASF